MRSKGTVAHGKRLIRTAGKRCRDLFDCVVGSTIDPDKAKKASRVITWRTRAFTTEWASSEFRAANIGCT
jgi:hypothetical protein